MRTRDFIWCINYESDAMEAPDNETYAKNISTTISPELKELMRKQQEKIDFYATYDVMTGVRIAATLGGFFGLMVLLVLIKSKSKTEKALEDPTLHSAAVAEAEEEERQIAAALEATAYEQLNPSKVSRRSLDTSSVSPRWIRNSKRFSSIAGYASLMEPPIRLSSKLPCSIDEDSPIDDGRLLYDDIYTSCYEGHNLGVPNRRASNVTCSSSGSSYLERRGSSVMLGLPTVPSHKIHHLQQMRRRQSSPLPEQYDFYYPIDIRVIQPTPGGSPCGSERALYDVVPPGTHLTPRLAPLASISSCNTSLANDYPDLDQLHASYCSDSVFHDMEYYEDTDDEIDPFSTDSDEEQDEQELDLPNRPCCSQDYHRRLSSLGKPVSPLSTISDESTSTLIGVGVKTPDDENPGIHMLELRSESRLKRRPSVSSTMSASSTLGALGSVLETLEKKRDSCCSMDSSPLSSPHSPTMRLAIPIGGNENVDRASASNVSNNNDEQEAAVVRIDVPQIEVVDVDDSTDTGVWCKETLF